MTTKNELILFETKQIRKVWYNEQWYFSVIDVIEVLTDSPQPSRYWNAIKKKEPHLFSICEKVKLKGQDGKSYPSDCANTEGLLRIIMSVPSPKAEPLKLWLAQVGNEYINEAESPEILTERQKEIYRAKGYTDEWITRRMQTIETRNLLTSEWKKRGVTDNQEYSILTAVIAKGTFGVIPSEHAKIKGLERENLRDHMTPIELIFAALGEETTRILAEKEDAQGFNENHEAAINGGRIVGDSRIRYEKEVGVKVVSDSNFLQLIKGDKEKK